MRFLAGLLVALLALSEPPLMLAAANAARVCCLGVVCCFSRLISHWWVVLGSNQWPLLCESSALPLS